MKDNAAADPPAEDEQPLWKLNRDEQQVLWITIIGTFVGGVASIVVGAGVLAIAVFLAKSNAPTGGHERGTIWFVFTGGLMLTMAVGMHSLYRMREVFKRHRFGRAMYAITLILAGYLFSEILLSWLGIAAGIH